MCSCSILSTCPNHLRRRCVMSLVMFWLPVSLYSSLFDILFGQKIWHIRRRHLLWNTSSFLTSVFTIRQVSEPYNKTDLTLLLYSSLCCDLVVVVRLGCFNDPESYAGGSFVLLAGLTIYQTGLGGGVRRKAAHWPSRLGVGRGTNNATP